MALARQFERSIPAMSTLAAYPRKVGSTLLAIGFAAAAVAVAFAARWMPLFDTGDAFPLITLYPAVTVSAVVGGYRAGLFALVLSMIGMSIFFTPFGEYIDLVRIVAFILSSLLIVAICEAMHRAQARAGEARANVANARAVLDKEQRLQWALQASGGAAWEWNPKTAVIWWSPEMYPLWGAEPGSPLQAESVFSLVHDKDRKTLQTAIETAIAQRANFRCEFRILHAKRGERWMLSIGRLTFDDIGMPGRIVGMTFDITERKQIQLALTESERRFRVTFENAAVGMAHLAPDGTWLSVNGRLCEIVGYSAKELVRKNFQQITHPDDLETDTAQVRRVLAGEIDHFGLEKRFQRKDGSIVWVDLTVGCVRRESGEVEYFISVVEDISTRKQAEEALRESEIALRAIVDTAIDAIVVIDDRGCLQSVNPATERMFGYSAEELVDQNVAMLFPAQDIPSDDCSENVFTRSIGDESAEREFDGRRKDGTIFPIDLTVTEWRDADGRQSFTGMMRDITERKQVQEELARKRRMEVIGQLAGGVAHDFNNLLAVIIGNLELAEPFIQQENARKMVRKALEAAEIGASFNQRLLSLARKRRLEPESINLNRWISGTVMLLERTLDANIILSTDLADDLWSTRADAGEVESAVLNLALNARDAMPHGGKLVIKTRNVTLDGAIEQLSPDARPGDFVLLSAIDTGRGMTPEVLQRALEPFFTTKQSGKGTGLGLSSVSNFVRQSDGFLTLESEVGKGTTFNLYLPRAPAQKPASEPAAGEDGAEAPAGGELILVVEDDDRVREVTLKRLENLGYAVCEARSAQEAIKWLESDEPIKLVFSDILMPGSMTGRDLAQWMDLHKPAVNILLTSGYDDDKHRANSRLKVLRKPYSSAEFANNIRKLLDSRAS